MQERSMARVSRIRDIADRGAETGWSPLGSRNTEGTTIKDEVV
jgi:hypothetical protein